jgi:hypothetical protein
MTKKRLSRRDFLKLSALGLTSLALRPTYNFGELADSDNLIRVGTTSVSVYSQPDEKSVIRFQRYRDEIINVYYEVISDKAPLYNPLWYRVWGGYIHCANVQRVRVKLNPTPTILNAGLHLIEITVPFAQSYLQRRPGEWTPIYRLYFGTVHWVVGIVEGPDGEPWYRIVDELIQSDNLNYYIPAKYGRIIPTEETTPISPDVNPDKKYVEVSLAQQELTAYEEGRVVLKTKISSGLDYQPPNEIPWNTPTGRFHVQTKMPSKHMGGAELTDDVEAYVLPGVPWTSFFEPEIGIAFHGTYWHQNFGMPMSHGCVNMRTEEARWLYRWLTPAGDMSKITTVGYGTQVHVF